MNNPFQYGRELGAADLVDREKEVAEVVSTIREGGKLFLIGPRRYGKTSVLQAAQTQAEREGAIILRYDAEVYPSLDLLARAILVEATERLSTNLEKVGTNVKKFFARLKPELSFNAGNFADRRNVRECGVAIGRPVFWCLDSTNYGQSLALR